MSWLKQILFGNVLLKVSALLSALALWLYVDTIVSDSKTLSIPVAVRGAEGTNVVVLDDATEADSVQARVTFRGPKDTVSLLTAQAIRGELVIPAGTKDGESVVPLGADSFILPEVQGLIVVCVEPSCVTVKVGRGKSRQD